MKKNNKCRLNSRIQRYFFWSRLGKPVFKSNPKDAYEYFLKVFSVIYDLALPFKTISVKRKTLQNTWMTKGLLKSFERKQKLYEKLLEKRTPRNESIWKSI